MTAIRKIPSLVAELPADPLSPWERAGVRVLASPEWERAGVRVRSMSAKLDCSAFHHSYFTLYSSTGCLGYGL